MGYGLGYGFGYGLGYWLGYGLEYGLRSGLGHWFGYGLEYGLVLGGKKSHNRRYGMSWDMNAVTTGVGYGLRQGFRKLVFLLLAEKIKATRIQRSLVFIRAMAAATVMQYSSKVKTYMMYPI